MATLNSPSGEEEMMAGEDQVRFEDFLALERYIEELQAGRVAHVPAELTPDLTRIYRMAMSFHAASNRASLILNSSPNCRQS